MKHYIVYSHGFGVRKDDRGLFTDIAASMPEAEHIFIDYNEIDDANNVLTVSSLQEQSKRLRAGLAILDDGTEKVVDIVAHSQGCLVAVMANSINIRKTIFLAPPSSLADTEEKLKQMALRPGTEISDDTTVRYPRRDGSTTIVTKAYWESRKGVDPLHLYNDLSKTTSISMITANQDEVLGNTDFSSIQQTIEVRCLDANHDFTDAARFKLVDLIKELLAE